MAYGLMESQATVTSGESDEEALNLPSVDLAGVEYHRCVGVSKGDWLGGLCLNRRRLPRALSFG
jgi:hypothetical protein